MAKYLGAIPVGASLLAKVVNDNAKKLTLAVLSGFSRASSLLQGGRAVARRQIVYHFDIYLEQSNSFLRTSGSPL
ncbi:hypothetical protein [Pseudomonas sp. AP42]|uniref:hypothetical protein n=1 Tax=Pseudomonas sp. AP42 TaxID=1535632 RepID=UPI001112DD3E|nr:hypothetical protein [Pseudomonas sp. AP42]